ncbi:MAG: hypothetical protein PHU71_05190 [Candidatus Gracilibacteria bacterium]|nr:hypothetical protein [Candidatus Gracilibacteria bacterium]
MYTQIVPYLVQLGDSSSSQNSSLNDFSANINPDPSQGYDLVDLANKGIAVAILLAGALSLIFMLYGGISFILSGGKEDKVKSSMNTIRYSIIGLVITILSLTIINIIGSFFGVNLVNYLSFSEIVKNANSFLSGLGN